MESHPWLLLMFAFYRYAGRRWGSGIHLPRDLRPARLAWAKPKEIGCFGMNIAYKGIRTKRTRDRLKVRFVATNRKK
jgi:hypothetical protein